MLLQPSLNEGWPNPGGGAVGGGGVQTPTTLGDLVSLQEFMRVLRGNRVGVAWGKVGARVVIGVPPRAIFSSIGVCQPGLLAITGAKYFVYLFLAFNDFFSNKDKLALTKLGVAKNFGWFQSLAPGKIRG